MKKYMMAFIVSIIAPLSIAYGATSGNPGKARSTTLYRRVGTTQKSRPASTNFYYNNQSGRKKYARTSGGAAPDTDRDVVTEKVYTNNRNYDTGSYGVDSYTAKSYTEKKQVNYSDYSQKKVVSQERKYFLAHPFFQPLKGRFGSVTDVAMAHGKFGFDLLNETTWDLVHLDSNGVAPQLSNHYPFNPIISGNAEANQFLIKQDFSFGLTDTVAVIAMGQYDSTKLKFTDWSTGDPDDVNSDNGLNVFGFGAQIRFLDLSDAIGMALFKYESQRDTADSLWADLKLGYKFDRTTLYLVGRGGYSWLKQKNTNYGFYLDDPSGDYLMLTYKRNVSDLFYAEGGMGVFSVLNKYFTVNAEAFFGNYDWHNQLTAKAAFGIQPFDSFALNVYASGVLYDSAEGQVKEYLNYDVNPVAYPSTTLVYREGDYKIKNYSEYKFGAQLILYF